MDLLERLSEVAGVPGREERVRAMIRDEVEAHCDSIETDALGNLICFKAAQKIGDQSAQRMMVACHMDEIGFMVRSIDDNGFLRVQQLGGFDVRNLFARRVLIQGRRDIVAVMNPSGRPIHLATDEEKKKIPRIIDLVIDTGLSAEEVREVVRPGDPVSIHQGFLDMGDKVTGKALDNRVACWIGTRLLQGVQAPAFDLYVVFTVQEEVGVRGATTAAYRVDPDIGVAVDTTLAVDVPGIPDEEQITKLGDGTAIKVMDGYTISDHRLVERFVALAEEKEIPHQLEILPLGGTDQMQLQRARMGARTVTLSVPTRYIHTATETIAKGDLYATLHLLRAFCEDGLGE